MYERVLNGTMPVEQALSYCKKCMKEAGILLSSEIKDRGMAHIGRRLR